jgi:hypothetical protein
VAQVVEHLLCMSKALNSNPSLTKETKQNKIFEKIAFVSITTNQKSLWNVILIVVDSNFQNLNFPLKFKFYHWQQILSAVIVR